MVENDMKHIGHIAWGDTIIKMSRILKANDSTKKLEIT